MSEEVKKNKQVHRGASLLKYSYFLVQSAEQINWLPVPTDYIIIYHSILLLLVV